MPELARQKTADMDDRVLSLSNTTHTLHEPESIRIFWLGENTFFPQIRGAGAVGAQPELRAKWAFFWGGACTNWARGNACEFAAKKYSDWAGIMTKREKG